ncbi:MAG: hypothetical protein CM15mP116_08780 [Synechococcus sp.]|nr:MAG: hypothetical protein CM15mP116_08780 [Synechococcus sp.]
MDVDTSESNTLDQQTLDLSGLAKRVGMSYQKISARRRRSDFATWISKHDPDGHAWRYAQTVILSRLLQPDDVLKASS